ncbi:conserved hypothetical protein [Solidesulfovibrio fructosivorans JJ]]|uniref:Uncharacterized protein n=1 Tax=Solidesulfovibrio fructosivorans JJ] TaxID=596151 RepID=E1JZ13_SOLFR|nr:hypothetical protein [Solidesulfovibrio fructosivorans]EFL50429.1 conserved hypothetical protein [Solidesulfovibrio fructosivorans JJ]]
MKQKCRMCRYWKGPIPPEHRYCPPEEMTSGDWGYCKRHAPAPASVPVEQARGKTYVAVWPETLADDLCGEFVLIPLNKE